jgi:cytochrome oxidase Cu insertion factor (SCO1/SenC/PrrC family)
VKRRLTRILRLACTLAFLCVLTGAMSPAALAQDQIAPLNVKEGDKAPDFALEDGNGKTVRLSDYRGHAVLLDFFRGYW